MKILTNKILKYIVIAKHCHFSEGEYILLNQKPGTFLNRVIEVTALQTTMEALGTISKEFRKCSPKISPNIHFRILQKACLLGQCESWVKRWTSQVSVATWYLLKPRISFINSLQARQYSHWDAGVYCMWKKRTRKKNIIKGDNKKQ